MAEARNLGASIQRLLKDAAARPVLEQTRLDPLWPPNVLAVGFCTRCVPVSIVIMINFKGLGDLAR